MRVAIIGTGTIGSALASLFVRHGHTVLLGSRRPDEPNALADHLALRPLSYRAANEASDLLCFCIAWEHSASAIALLGELSGKILIDPSNPETPDGRSLLLGHSTSGAEILASLSPGARVVKAFNCVYAELLEDAAALARVAPSIFLCGDDSAARDLVSNLVRSCDLEPIDCGPLANARYLEPLALLMVQLVRKQGWPPAAVGMKLSHD